MKQRSALLVFSACFVLLSCNRNASCACVDEKLQATKTYRERGYKGDPPQTGAACKDYVSKTDADFRKFDSLTRRCPNYGELQEETRLMNRHLLDEHMKKAEQLGEKIGEKMKELEESLKELGGN